MDSYYYNNTPNTHTYGWGDVDSREAHSSAPSYYDDSESYDGLEMRPSSRQATPSTFGLGARKPRRSPPRDPFRQEATTSAPPLTSSCSSSSSSSSSSERHCCSSTRRDPIPLPQKADTYEDPLNPLSPRPSTKRNSISRPGAGLRSNTRTSFTANGDRVEEYNGQGSLRIGTHWVDEDEARVEASGTGLSARGASAGLGVRGGRRGSGYGDVW